MTRYPDVFVVIPTLGERPAWFRDSAASVLAAGAHLCVVAPRAVRGCLGLREDDFIFAEDVGGGAAHAVAAGWRLAPTGVRYISWLGDDDLLAPGSIERTRTALDNERPTAGGACGRVRCIDEEGATRFIYRPTRVDPHLAAIGKNRLPQPGSLFRRSAIEEIGGLSVAYRASFDFDLFLRVHRRAGGIAVLSDELAAFRLHSGSITGSKSPMSSEDDLVRQNVLGWSGRRVRGVRSLVAHADRVIDAIQRRLPSPPAPELPKCRTGYTHSGAWAREYGLMRTAC
jgi:hypothetical protein